ncbi:DUF5719 family protein [Microbacterium sp. ASV49]|uniref:DUF5719 family protein n=1 Tax=Microbacterium candidum TaxID=3041922 RepID=A0ABT7N0Z6_9MICO|nr:DUF5719 family protein [Microbacterium sp. ASV49]MDL9980340.1 DUF5719 family protein [Microbacterium sp. ASV49]
MSDRRILRMASTGARVLAGALVSAVFVTAVVTAVAIPWPTHTQAPVQVTAQPAPASTVVVCGGPLLALGRNASNAAALSVAATQSLAVGVPDGDPAPTESTLAVPDARGAGPTVLTAAPQDGVRSEVAGAGSASVQASDLAGLAASSCQSPRMESWLVGGATTTGASDLVLLANPGAVAATVDLTVYGALGAQVPPGGRGVVIPPASERVLPLAGLILGEQAPVVHVEASGAPVRAALQTSLTRTLVPGGVDQVSAVSSADKLQIIPGVAVIAQAAQTSTDNPTTVLRVLSPLADATATVTVVGSTGATELTQKIPLKAGLPAELELAGLPAGVHTVRVAADQRIVSAVWSTTGFGQGADFAWYPAAPEIAASTLFAVPAGPSSVLSIANPGTAPVAVKLTPVGGAVRSVTIPAGRAVDVPVSPLATYTLDPQGGAKVRATISYSRVGGSGTTGDALAAIPVWPSDAAAHGIVVYPG